VRECGLKLGTVCGDVWIRVVTPRAGVWIETFSRAGEGTRLRSLPVRECGLKRLHKRDSSFAASSLPVRECGLKPMSTALHGVSQCHSPCGSVD